MYVIADKYDVPALKDLAVEEFQKGLFGRNASDERETQPLVEAMKIMYEETPEMDRDLKDVATDFIVRHADSFLDWAPFESLCKDIGEIGLDVARQFKKRKAECPECSVVYYTDTPDDLTYCYSCGEAF